MGNKADIDITILTYKVINRIGCRRNPSAFPRRNRRGVYNTYTITVKFSGMNFVSVKNIIAVKVKVCLKSVRG
jgi:hypothetical protein